MAIIQIYKDHLNVKARILSFHKQFYTLEVNMVKYISCYINIFLKKSYHIENEMWFMIW